MLEQYDRVIPGGADRILRMAEKQLDHRQDLEGTVVKGNVTSQHRGQIFAFVLGLVAILGGIWLIAHDKSPEGLATIITALGGLAAVFIYGRRQQERERQQKRDEVAEALRQSGRR